MKYSPVLMPSAALRSAPIRIVYSGERAKDPFVLSPENDERLALDRRQMGPFDAVRVTYNRQPSHQVLDPLPSGDCFLVVHVAGGTIIGHDDQGFHCDAGDVVLVDSSRTLHIRRDGRLVLLTVRIPASLMETRLPCWRERSCIPLARGVAALLGSLVRTGFEQVAGGSRRQDKALQEALLSLLSAADTEPSEPAEALTPPILRTIQNSLLARLGDTDLSPQQLARQHGLSERQLHRVFHSAGISLCRWIRQTRLDRCAADLSNPAMCSRSVTQIAFEWGFNDAAHFSRVFRAEFDRSPREYRAAALAVRRN